MKNFDWSKLAFYATHIALFFGSAYVAANPELVWLMPAMQATGQLLTAPIIPTATPLAGEK